MEFVAGWLVLAVVVAVIARSRGRSGFAWFLLACLFSPLIMGILVLALPSQAAPLVNGERITTATHGRCSDCMEFVRRDARKCKHCGASLTTGAGNAA